jgi:hypothetical protein
MVRRPGPADTSGVHVETLSPDLVRTVDAIELPPVGAEVLAWAERTDSYPIWVTRSPEETVERLLQTIGEAHVAVITDETVADLYGPLILGALRKAGVRPEVAAVPAGERHKTLRQAMKLLDWLTGTQVGRRDLIICLGGGVVIDMGGWVASAYMRGVPYLPLPTTLIGQVDAGIGGYGFECSAELVGSERTLRIGARGRSTDLDELSTLGTLSHIAEDNIERHGSAYRDELRHFVHCVASDEEPCVTGEDAIAALRLALMAERSAA